MNTTTFRRPSIRGSGAISDITVQQGLHTLSIHVNGIEVLTKIRGNPWAVGEDVDLWQIADAAAALCKEGQ